MSLRTADVRLDKPSTDVNNEDSLYASQVKKEKGKGKVGGLKLGSKNPNPAHPAPRRRSVVGGDGWFGR